MLLGDSVKPDWISNSIFLTVLRVIYPSPINSIAPLPLFPPPHPQAWWMSHIHALAALIPVGQFDTAVFPRPDTGRRAYVDRMYCVVTLYKNGNDRYRKFERKLCVALAYRTFCWDCRKSHNLKVLTRKTNFGSSRSATSIFLIVIRNVYTAHKKLVRKTHNFECKD